MGRIAVETMFKFRLWVPDHPHIQQTYVGGQEPGNLFFGLTVGEVGEVGEVNSDTVDR